MNSTDFPYATSPIEPSDAKSKFSCGKHALDDYFARHALANDAAGIGRASVLRRAAEDSADVPEVLGFYTLSMALVDSEPLTELLARKLPKYPMPVALIGRLAVDHRAKGRRFGEKLLMDALRRVVDAANILGCTGIIVDAKDEDGEAFYLKYDFVGLEPAGWPRRMFLPIHIARAAFAE